MKTDEELLKNLRNGDEVAQDMLYNRYKTVVRGISRSLYLAGHSYDDLIQEGMIGLFKAVKSYDESKGSIKSYFTNCIKNQLLDAVKSANREKHRFLNDYVSLSNNEAELEPSIETIPSSTLSPEDILLDKENNIDFFKSFENKLKTQEMKIFKLYLDGHTYIDIALMSNVSKKYVDNTIQKIKKIAKRLYET